MPKAASVGGLVIAIYVGEAKLHVPEARSAAVRCRQSSPPCNPPCSRHNATVNITVAIAAEFPDGATDQVKRAVSENARSLGLKSADWE